MKKSPYIKTESEEYIPSKEPGIGMAKTDALVSSGDVTETELAMMRFFYEFGEMTASMVKEAFSHPWAAHTQKESSSGKNPYRKEILRLCEKKVLLPSSVTKDGRERLRVYRLSNGARKWCGAHADTQKKYYDHCPNPRRPAISEICALMDHLSAASFLIKAISSGEKCLTEYTVQKLPGAGRYEGKLKTRRGLDLILKSIREYDEKEIRSTLRDFKKRYPDKTLLILLPDTEDAEKLMDSQLVSESPSICGNILFATDMSTRTEGTPRLLKLNDDGTVSWIDPFPVP